MNKKNILIFYFFAPIIICMFILSGWIVNSFADIQYKTPQVLIVLDNSQSMDGDLSGAIMTGSGTATSNSSNNGFVDQSSSSPIDYNVPLGFTAPLTTPTSGGTAPYTSSNSSGDLADNSASRLNVAKAAIQQVLKDYSNDVEFGLMDYGVTGTPALYTTWVYYMSGPSGFTFGTSSTAPSGLTAVANPCYYSNTQATTSCKQIRSFFGNGVGTFSDPYLYIQDTSDEPSINDVLYDENIHSNVVFSGPYATHTSTCPKPSSSNPDPYTSFNLTDYNNNCILIGYSNASDSNPFPTGPTNAGYVPYSYEVWYSERGFGYDNSLSGGGNLVVSIGSSNAASFLKPLKPETINPSSPEIKADAVNAPMAGTLASALSYLTGSSIPTVGCPGNKYVIFITDGLPTYGTGGHNWPPLGSAAAAGYGVTATFNSDGSLNTTTDNALSETITAIENLKAQGIETYVIGMGAGVDPSLNPQAAATLKAMAVAGGTNNYFPATTPQDVANDLSIIVKEIMASGSYTTPVIHQTTTSTDKYFYYADLNATLKQPLWGEGNIFVFQTDNGAISDCPVGSGLSNGLIGPTGGPQVFGGLSPSSSTVTKDYSNYFSCVETQTINSQGETVTTINQPPAPPFASSGSYDSFWDMPNGLGAGDTLQNGDYYPNNPNYGLSPSGRDVFTSYLNAATGQETDINIVTTPDSNSELQSLLGTSSNYASLCGSTSTAASCTEDIINFVLNPSSKDGWKLGAIYHSDPVIIGVPSIAIYENPSSSSSITNSCSYTGSYYEFYYCEQHRQQVLVVGANDGMFHGFDAGSYGGNSYGATSTTYGYGSGEEMFGYIPPDLLPGVSNWYQSSFTNPPSSGYYPQDKFVDSTPAVSDVYFNNVFDGSSNSVAGVQAGWHTVLISGERQGGNYYFALDTTHPSQLSSSTYPAPLWDITDSSMGQTWSRPIIGFICLPNSNTSSSNGVCSNSALSSSSTTNPPQYVKNYIAIVGGGYSSTGSTGDAVYALYVEPNPVNQSTSGTDYADEQVLWKYDTNYPVPSEVAPVFDTNGASSGNAGVPSGELEAFYVGDLGGDMYAFLMPSIASGTVTAGSQWSACQIFTQPTASPLLNIFYPPAISYDNSGNLWVYFGTGNRAALNSPSNTRPNEFLAVNTGDVQPGTCPSSAPYTLATSSSSPGLVNVTGAEITISSNGTTTYTLNGTTSSLSSVSYPDGWYITLPNPGERVVSSPVVYNGIIYFTTYTPASNSCGEGTALSYALNYTNGGGMVITNSSGSVSSGLGSSQSPTGTGQQSGIIGVGIPSAPIISGNTLYVATSGGGLAPVTIQGHSTGLNPTSWFELP